ncbi:cytochrome c peroxidase [Fluviicoccus keumensis]|uniref:Cytochrome c peroxidase n=2 Tax=Fluviicoccus keumensis TaxID=1435465 RepID=A0A4Q7Z8S6_9GAMM|nr:cytochrome c peroxidase [Fluviicoccus keumensis]
MVSAVVPEADPTAGRALPKISDAVPTLGRALFFSKSLSGDRDTACASCHHPLLAGTDSLSLPVGVNAVNPDLLGPGRTLLYVPTDDPVPGNGPNVPRNSPTTFNIALYDRAMFHDGRAFILDPDTKPNGAGQSIRTPDSLLQQADPLAGANLTEGQARFPVTSLFEMRGFGEFSTLSNDALRAAIVSRLKSNSQWVSRFKTAFNITGTPDQVVTFERVTKALSDYQRSQIFVSSPWLKYRQGDNAAITDLAKTGAKLFFKPISNGGAGCVSCHSGSHFTDEKFHVSGFPQLGRGKNTFGEDDGRREVTQSDSDIFAFRTPSLLNASRTAPFGHAGSFTTLYETIAYHVNPEAGLSTYDFSLKSLDQFRDLTVTYPRVKTNTQDVVAQFKKSPDYVLLNNPALTPTDISALVAFVQTLTDYRLADSSALQPWIASDVLGDNPDGQMLTPCFSNPGLGAACLNTGGGGTGTSTPADFNELSATGGVAIPPVTLAVSTRVLANAVNCPDGRGAVNQKQRRFVTATGALDFSHTFALNIDSYIREDNVSVNASNLAGLAVGDINADCWPDVVFASGLDGVVTYLNDQGKGWIPSSSLPKHIDAGLVTSLGIADIDGDYKSDVVYGNFLGQKLYILENRWPSFIIHDESQTNISPAHNTYGMAFGDYDNDGDVDMLTGHWTDKSNIARSGHLRENMGDWKFSSRDASKGLVGLVNSNDFSFSPNFADINNDGKLDILFTGDFKNSQVFINNGNGFTRTTDPTVITDENGMGAAVGDFDNDGDLDWFVGSIYGSKTPSIPVYGITGNRMYRNDGKGGLTDVTDSAGVRDGGWAWGTCAADFDNDGDLDIFQVNGYILPDQVVDYLLATFPGKEDESRLRELQNIYSVFLNDTSRLFINNGAGVFTEEAAAWGLDDTRQGRGISCLDVDRDGDIDIVTANHLDKPSLRLNQVAGRPDSHFLQVRLVGISPNTEALGARVYITVGGKTQMREVSLGSNYLGNNPAEVHFGTGTSTRIDELKIVWPGGSKTTVMTGVDADRFLVIGHPDIPR